MRLELVSGPHHGTRVFSVNAEPVCVIGRTDECGICLDDSDISRRHAEIVNRGDHFLVRDLNSKNGTHLNGELITEARLHHEDRLRMGQCELRVVDATPASTPPSASVTFPETQSAVLLTLNHHKADIVLGAGAADNAHETRLLRTLCGLARLLVATDSPDAIIRRILDELHGILNADTACLLVRDQAAGNEWVVRVASSRTAQPAAVQVSRSILSGALREGNAFLTTDPLDDSRFDASKSIVDQGVSSALCAPLMIGGDCDGVLFVDRRRRQEVFTSLDLRLTATVGNMLAVFLEKEHYENEVREKTRLATIGEVVAGLAHYIKNILTGLGMTSAVLKTAVQRNKPEHIASLVDTISDIHQRISDLMLNMLSYSKDRRPEPSIIDMDRLVHELITPYRPRLDEQGIAFDYRRADEAVVYADEQALHRILLNLFLNAVDALDARQDEAPKQIGLNVISDHGTGGIELRFSDTGNGIPADMLDRVFDSFVSSKGSRGTGLGLAVTHKLVGEHGGAIAVTSEVGRGTEFRIRLPAAPDGCGIGM